MELKVEYVPTNTLVTYENNAKIHTGEQIDQIKRSIESFGFNDPIAVWHDNVIIEGHGRLIAALELGMEELPIIRLDELTDEQRKAYMLVHNQLTMNTGFDFDILNEELENINIDMSQFGIEMHEDDYDYDERNYEEDDEDIDERDPSFQHNVFENQDRMQFPIVNFYGFPEIKATQTTGNKFLRFADWKEVDNPEEYIAHFFYDDYKFMSAWREPDKYLDRLMKFKAVISPDFSLYTDFPRALQILSCYRRQWCGAFWQHMGIDVIPDVIWGDEESYDYCFEGIPVGGTVAVSSVGVKNDDAWNNKVDSLFKKGFDEMMKRIQPTTILYYGDMIDGLEGNIIRIPSYYEQKRGMLNELAKAKKVKANGKGQ